ncbi:acyclic terpene utilization AtuA family protein [Sporosarcina cyprini]|uniref:acyclic terpene utilization AtuA family protein n=1 Tax=Sporosarcina cyprini TaxID=2910523 RepID=UPI001EDD1C09|nr:acyclic terpene utilization AtuA family protein [Sporosarcina cyprini]MCG3088048.1 DUF1446 domain-containing protein [Sporosarcina cyprini]
MLRIGSGAGFSGDRLEPAVELAQRGRLDYLVLECLAERTIALAQKRKQQDPTLGYDPLLEKRMRSLLPIISENGVRIITNMGAANPVSAAEKIIEIAEELKVPIKVAAVTGDDVFMFIHKNKETVEFFPSLNESDFIISANAYMGADAIVAALETGANIIITGRVADPSLFLAPMIHHFGWSAEDEELLGRGTVIGHLLECGGQITGGYFADPGMKDVPDMARLGFPIAEIQPDGTAVISKLPGTGGILNRMTVKEQLLYEVMDPSEYMTPDVMADFTSVCIREVGIDQVEVTGGHGKKRPDRLKASIGYEAGFIGEGEITYAGHNALKRAELAGAIVKTRLQDRFKEVTIDLIGVTSAHRGGIDRFGQPYEVRLRVAAKAECLEDAQLIGEEVEALYTNGPAGGGGARKYVQEVVGIVSAIVPREAIQPTILVKEAL